MSKPITYISIGRFDISGLRKLCHRFPSYHKRVGHRCEAIRGYHLNLNGVAALCQRYIDPFRSDTDSVDVYACEGIFAGRI